jgi:hypothetical protein
MGILHDVQSFFETIVPVMDHLMVRKFYYGKEPPEALMRRPPRLENKNAEETNESRINRSRSHPGLTKTLQNHPRSNHESDSTADRPYPLRNLSRSGEANDRESNSANNNGSRSLWSPRIVRQQSEGQDDVYMTPARTMSPGASHADHAYCEKRIQQLEDKAMEDRRQSLLREHNLENTIVMKDREIRNLKNELSAVQLAQEDKAGNKRQRRV